LGVVTTCWGIYKYDILTNDKESSEC